MKSRTLLTTPVIIVTDYSIQAHPSGKSLHSFHPENTGTLYQFLANKEPVLTEGERYNIAYTVDDATGTNWVEISATARAEAVDPAASYAVASALGEQSRQVEVGKSAARVVHTANDGTYLGVKYAWRIYGMAIAREAFELYLNDRKHPSVPCLTDGNPSTAFKEAGLKDQMDALFASLIHISGNRYKSLLFPSKSFFLVKGISAITDKK